MKNLNTITVGELARILKVDSAKLIEHLQTDEADLSKQETKVSELITGREVFTEEEKNQLLFNTDKIGYQKGKLAESEMKLKEEKKKWGFDPVDPSIKDISTLVTKIVEQEKTKLGTQPDKRVTDLENEKANLQKTVNDLTTEVGTWKSKVGEAQSSANIQASIQSAIANTPIDADDTRLASQREILQLAFEKKHEIKIEEGKAVLYKDGKKLVDNLQNAISIEAAMKDFAPQYVNLKTKSGRGDSSSQNSTLSADLASIKDKRGLAEYLSSKNIRQDSQEALAVLKEVREKNPAFKLN